MPSPALEPGILPVPVDRLLVNHQGGRRLEADAHQNVLPVGDASLNTAGVVGGGTHPAALHVKRVIMFQTGHARRFKTGTHGESLGGGNAHHGVG